MPITFETKQEAEKKAKELNTKGRKFIPVFYGLLSFEIFKLPKAGWYLMQKKQKD